MKKLIIILLLPIVLAWCSEADSVSYNLSKEADYFNVNRRIVFYNWITWEYMLTIEWFCSLWNNDTDESLSVTCKVGNEDYKKHYLWLSDNVTYFVEQISSKNVSKDHYKVVFKPSLIVPDVDIR